MITAVRNLMIKKGSAGSHAFECDDGRTYFVKFNDGTRTVVNELIGYALADMLSLPVPENHLVSVPQELVDASEDLGERRVSGGIHHGTVWMEGCVDFSGVSVREMVLSNANMLPGLIVLDNLVVNMDRNNPGNNLLQATPRGNEYKTVDFSEILSGRNWTIDSLNVAKRISYLMPVFTVVALQVKGLSSFSPWLESCEDISGRTIDGILSTIPASWNVTDEEKVAITDFLLARKGRVRGILESGKSRFLNWK